MLDIKIIARNGEAELTQRPRRNADAGGPPPSGCAADSDPVVEAPPQRAARPARRHCRRTSDRSPSRRDRAGDTNPVFRQ